MIWAIGFPKAARPLDLASFHVSLEEVTVCAGNEVLQEVNVDSALIVGGEWEIFGKQLWPNPIQYLNITILVN